MENLEEEILDSQKDAVSIRKELVEEQLQLLTSNVEKAAAKDENEIMQLIETIVKISDELIKVTYQVSIDVNVKKSINQLLDQISSVTFHSGFNFVFKKTIKCVKKSYQKMFDPSSILNNKMNKIQ